MNKPFVTYSWMVFFIFLGAVLLWFTISTVYHLYQYAVLQENTPALSTQWSVVEISDDKYILNSDYTFQVNGKPFSGSTRMTSLSFRNSWAAEKEITKLSEKSWTVWYSAGNPEHSTLQKEFPIKEAVSTLLLWGILGYFYWLFSYMRRYNR